MTFAEIYEEQKSKPTPARDFILKIAELTSKSPLTVKRWVQPCTNIRPDRLTQMVLASHFGTTPEELFPAKEDIS